MKVKFKLLVLLIFFTSIHTFYGQCPPIKNVSGKLKQASWNENSQTTMLELTQGKAYEHTFIAQRGVTYRIVIAGGGSGDQFTTKPIQYQIHDKEGRYITENGETYYRKSSTLIYDSRTSPTDEFIFISPKTRKFTVTIRSVAQQTNANCVLFLLESKD
jgi:hypothetical protein